MDGIVADEVGCTVVPGGSVRYCALTRERKMKSRMRLKLEDMGEMLDGCLRSDGFLGAWVVTKHRRDSIKTGWKEEPQSENPDHR